MSHKVRTDLEIISSVAGQSGLKLTNLVSGTPATTFNGVLGLDASGNVVKIDSTKLAIVTVAAVAPSTPSIGQQWLNTSVSPSELMIWNGTSWEQANNEVQHYANLAAFPATGTEGIVYIADDTDIVYVWDSTTSTYQDVTTLPSGLFSISDGTTTVPVAPSDTITFQESADISNVLKFQVASGDVVEIQANTATAVAGQVVKYDGTNVVWANDSSDNIYNVDGTLDDPIRTVDFVTNQMLWRAYDTANASAGKHFPLTFEGATDTAVGIAFTEVTNGVAADGAVPGYGMVGFSGVGSLTGIPTPVEGMGVFASGTTASLHSDENVVLNSVVGEYYIWTPPTAATTQTIALVRDPSDRRLYLRDLSTISSARYVNTWTPVANVETVHTHTLGAGEDIQVQVFDAATKELVAVEVRIISATTFGVTSTTADPLKVVAI